MQVGSADDLAPVQGHLVMSASFVPPQLQQYCVKLYDGSPGYMYNHHLTNVLSALKPHKNNSSLVSAKLAPSRHMIEIELERNGPDTDKLMDLVLETLELNGADPNQRARATFNIPTGLASQLVAARPAGGSSASIPIVSGPAPVKSIKAIAKQVKSTTLVKPSVSPPQPPAPPPAATNEPTETAQQTFEDRTAGWLSANDIALSQCGLKLDDKTHLAKAENLEDLKARLSDIANGSPKRPATLGAAGHYNELVALVKNHPDAPRKKAKATWEEDHHDWVTSNAASLRAAGLDTDSLSKFSKEDFQNFLYDNRSNWSLLNNEAVRAYQNAAQGFGKSPGKSTGM